MPWLIRDGKVLCSVEVATTRRQRRRGLLGRESLDGAMVLSPARSVHTLGMRFPIDVAHVDADGTVIRVTTMARHRIGRSVWSARSVIEAPGGAFAHWDLTVGDTVEIRDGQIRDWDEA